MTIRWLRSKCFNVGPGSKSDDKLLLIIDR